MNSQNVKTLTYFKGDSRRVASLATEASSVLLPSLSGVAQSVADTASKAAYQKLTNAPGMLTGPVTHVKNLGGVNQALYTASALARNSLAGLLEAIDSIGTQAGEAGF